MTATEVIHHHRMNDKIQEMTVSCVYLSIHSKFVWLKIDFTALTVPIKCVCGIFPVPRDSQGPSFILHQSYKSLSHYTRPFITTYHNRWPRCKSLSSSRQGRVFESLRSHERKWRKKEPPHRLRPHWDSNASEESRMLASLLQA